MKIRRDDTVLVISGNDKGKRGRVLRVIPEQDRLIVEGIRMMKKHTKPTQRDPQGGIVEREAPIHVSNVMVIDPHNDEPTRVGKKRLDDGRNVRVAARSGEMIDSE
ncbi:MAG TPA: 50S ribosomal protein L24 [Candidatus Latescibacteria bacterium]|jgi:large subunit ribosomal protein L24|nr:50S ribosomal protein L24 [Gemmatimonadota bacterium]MDP7632677.1 50S ribosomal protein L24 [Candidatus Latescibacterota bacterium]MBU08070.1 50S ribosomal protein L24 [Gemmatimonadota bacterium]MED5414087.1 50S ribosomal protein L24 [Candidatus Latescibacterota bacterium]MEE3040504.1 50S ribosomal protein L24 [Candidatus Latescibacterota bacterium]|tara:strand:- start:5187 stop:5504 length:318 start_codon:yes stop_codon:yes gene_type:complete